jgi:hypothetical protein
LTVEHNETHWIIRLVGDCTMSSAGELKALLLTGLASEKRLQVDLELAGVIDITLLQLLWAAAHQTAPENLGCVTHAPEALKDLARYAGFESFPGEAGDVGPTSEVVESL